MHNGNRARYSIGDPIGEGGQAQLYVGVDLQSRDAVVLKQLKQQGHSSLPLEQFRREGQLRLAAPHTISPLDYIEDGQGPPTIVLPLVLGTNLDELLMDGWLPEPQEVVRILVQIAECLSQTHRLGIVHNDLKPQNVLLDSSGTVTVIDWGAHIDMANPFRGGQTIGTSGATAPEAFGRPESVEARSDQFGLGGIAFQSLGGTPPFESLLPDNQAAAQERAKKAATETPVSLITLNRRVPPELVRVIDRLLEKRPEQRFADMDEVIAALTGQPVRRAHSPSAAVVNGSGSIRCLACRGRVEQHSNTCGSCNRTMFPGVFLRLLDENGRRRDFRFATGSYVVGREQLAPSDRMLSRAHLRVEAGPAGLTVCDAGSANGTRVDGTFANVPIPMGSNSTILIGNMIGMVHQADT